MDSTINSTTASDISIRTHSKAPQNSPSTDIHSTTPTDSTNARDVANTDADADVDADADADAHNTDDDEIAAALGFTSFGAGTKRKRHDHQRLDAVVATSGSNDRLNSQNPSPTPATGANATSSTSGARTTSLVGASMSASAFTPARAHGSDNTSAGYFLPSFIEDPWAGLVPQRPGWHRNA